MNQDKQASEDFLHAELESLKSFVRAQTNSDVTDVVQDAAMKVLSNTRGQDFYRNRNPALGTWLRRAAKHVIIDRYNHSMRYRRSKHRTVPLAKLELTADDTSPTNALTRQFEKSSVQQAIESLEDPRDKCILKLIYIDQLSHQETSRRLGIAPGSIMRFCKIAEENLKKKLFFFEEDMS